MNAVIRLPHGTPPALSNRTQPIRMEEDHARPPLPGIDHLAVDLPIHRSAPTVRSCFEVIRTHLADFDFFTTLCFIILNP